MAYKRVNWEDAPSENTPLDAEHLNQMDEGIAKLDEEKMDKSGNADDAIVKFEESANLQKINSGSKLSMLFGVVANAISSLISHLSDTVSHITSTERTNWNDANSKKHTHSNKTTLDAITAAYTSEEKTKLSGISAGANAYTHPSYTARTGVPTANQTPAFGGSFQVSQPVSDATGHITGMNSRTVTIPSAVATQSAAGLESAADKKKLDGIAEGANAYTHPNSGATAGTYRSVTVNAQGHVTGGSNPTVTVAQGGTGATTAAAALTNLGASPLSHTHKYAGSSSAGGSATKAIGDSDGNQISTTYRKKSEGSIVAIQEATPSDTSALWVW
ncbi:MAG: hypothetical protein ACI4FZ_08720 [Lachnospiraceae bacterium]